MRSACAPIKNTFNFWMSFLLFSNWTLYKHVIQPFQMEHGQIASSYWLFGKVTACFYYLLFRSYAFLASWWWEQIFWRYSNIFPLLPKKKHLFSHFVSQFSMHFVRKQNYMQLDYTSLLFIFLFPMSRVFFLNKLSLNIFWRQWRSYSVHKLIM